MFWIFPKYWVKQDMNHESLPPKMRHKFQEVPKSKGITSKYLIKYFNNSTQPKPACYLIFFPNMFDLNPFPLPKALGTLGSLVPLTMLSLFSQKFKSQSTARSHQEYRRTFFGVGVDEIEKPCILTTFIYKSEAESIT